MPVKNIITGQKISAEKLQRAKELRREMTEAEKLLWAQMRTNRLGGFHFRRQQLIAGFIVDFYCHAADLVIEVDGSVHDFNALNDAEREQVMHEMGFRVLRIKNEAVFEDLEAVLRQILLACEG